MKKLILTACNGNIHRSVIAEEVIRSILRSRGLDEEYRVESRGIQGTGGVEPAKHKNIRGYPDEWALTKAALEPYGIDIPEEKESTPISRADAEEATVILVMDEKTLNNPVNGLAKQFPDLSHKMLPFSELRNVKEELPDPHGVLDGDLYKKIVSSIYDNLSEHFDRILSVQSA